MIVGGIHIPCKALSYSRPSSQAKKHNKLYAQRVTIRPAVWRYFCMSERPKERKLTTTAVAEIVGVSVPTIRRLAESGQLAGARVGRWYRFERAAVDDFVVRSERPLAA
jgi:excisionase family DNA binding protein